MYETICPNDKVTRSQLLYDIHGTESDFEDDLTCNGAQHYFKRSVSNKCNLDTSQITDFRNMFRQCPSSFGWHTITDWDVSSGTTFDGMFKQSEIGTTDISKWQTTEATSFYRMFANSNFNAADVSAWNTAKVTDFNEMFDGVDTFSQSISNWDFANYKVDSGFFLATKAADRSVRYYNLNMFDMLFKTSNNFEEKSTTYPALSYEPLVIENPPCWLKYTKSETEIEQTFQKCGAGINVKGCSCSFEVVDHYCTQDYINSLNLKCSTTQESAHALQKLREACPALNKGSIETGDDADVPTKTNAQGTAVATVTSNVIQTFTTLQHAKQVLIQQILIHMAFLRV